MERNPELLQISRNPLNYSLHLVYHKRYLRITRHDSGE